MGVTYSKADTAPPPMPNFTKGTSPVVQQALKDLKEEPTTDYLNLPPPVRYEDIQREVMMALKPDVFEGLRFEITRPLNQNFFLTHSLFMGNLELPGAATGSKQMLKVPVGTYEFGANLISEKGHFALGRITTDGRLSGRLKYDFADWLSSRVNMQLSNEAGQSQVMGDIDIKGKDWNGQVKLGTPQFLGLNYFQSITPSLSAGGEFFWLGGQLRSGLGLALRHTGEQHIATCQVASTGILSAQYAHKVTDKVTLATDLLYHWASREATATVGYDVTLRQARLQGKVDSAGVVSCYIMERFAPGINFLLSAELDHAHKNYKFGFGFTAGE